jgi:hypothetical protein
MSLSEEKEAKSQILTLDKTLKSSAFILFLT